MAWIESHIVLWLRGTAAIFRE
uniref:Uncharacterized protein n=1 Tax=Anguilla anguilla TaxID=7936 RepID=A0A0E9VXV8_ANGAN